MSKALSKPQTTYTINQVDSFDGTTTFELRRGREVLKIYPSEALQHAIDALARIEEYQGITKESELFKYTPGAGEVVQPSDES